MFQSDRYENEINNFRTKNLAKSICAFKSVQFLND